MSYLVTTTPEDRATARTKLAEIATLIEEVREMDREGKVRLTFGLGGDLAAAARGIEAALNPTTGWSLGLHEPEDMGE